MSRSLYGTALLSVLFLCTSYYFLGRSLENPANFNLALSYQEPKRNYKEPELSVPTKAPEPKPQPAGPDITKLDPLKAPICDPAAIQAVSSNYHVKQSTPGDIDQHLPVIFDYVKQAEHATEIGVRGVVSSWAFAKAGIERVMEGKKFTYRASDITRTSTTDWTTVFFPFWGIRGLLVNSTYVCIPSLASSNVAFE